MIAFKHAIGLTLASAVTALGCRTSAGTETDNPFHSEPEPEPPPYKSPIQFNPDAPGVPACPPSNDDTGPSRGPYWGTLDDQLIAGVERDQLIVIDVSDPALPVRLSVTELRGYVHTVVAGGDDVFIVVDERPEVSNNAIPAPSELRPATRLVHYDLANPSEPERVGAVDLPGEFWRLRARGDVLWLMAATLEDDGNSSCQLPGRGCYYPERTKLLLRGYRATGTGFDAIESLDLPMTQRAWAGADGFVSLTAEYTDEGVAPLALHVARFGDDGLVTSELRGLPGNAAGGSVPLESSPVEVVGSKLYYFSSSGQTDSATLHVVDVADEVAVELSTVSDIPGRPRDGVEFTEQRVVIGSEDFSRSAWNVDLSDPAAPVVKPFPSGVAQAASLDGGQWLAWGDTDGNGKLEFGLLGETELESITVTPSEVPSGVSMGTPLFPRTLWSSGQRVAFLYHHYEPYRRVSKVATIDLAAEPLVVTTFDEATFADELLPSGQWLLAPDFAGVAALPLGVEQDAVRTEFEDLLAIDVLPLGERMASLAKLVDGRRFVVVSEPTGRETARLEVPGTATHLIDVEGYVGVLLDEQGTECEQSQGRECSKTGLLLVDAELGENVGQVDLPRPPFESPSGTSTQGLARSTPLRLDSGQWVFVVTESLRCVLEVECDALGVGHRPLSEANVAAGSIAGCQPGVEECLPPPPEPEVYGSLERAQVYVLDPSDPSDPRFRAIGGAVLEEPDSSFAEPRIAGNRVLLSRLERTLERGQSTRDVVARFMLDSFSPDSDLSTWRSLNVPGYAIGASTDARILHTVEPRMGEGATLHRLKVTEQGAYVEVSRTLEGRFSGVHLIRNRAYHLSWGSDGCSDGLLQTIALDADLTLIDRVELPGPIWDFKGVDENALLLVGPNYAGYALFDVSAGEPSLLGFFDDLPEHVRLHDDELWWLSDGKRVEHRR